VRYLLPNNVSCGCSDDGGEMKLLDKVEASLLAAAAAGVMLGTVLAVLLFLFVGV
jgi:hypothetical protein